MPKKDFGEVLGKCKICTINLWSKTDGLPVILPLQAVGQVGYHEMVTSSSQFNWQRNPR